MMLTLIIKILIAHVIGDFVLQPDKWVEDKKNKKHRSIFFYIHGLVHLISLLVVFQFDLTYLPIIGIIAVSHLIIDLIKLNLEGRINTRVLFAIDQLFHLLIIGILVYLIDPYVLEFEKIYSIENLLLVLAILSVSFVSSICIKVIMSKWNLPEDKTEDSLTNAGKYIGILERLFVFSFIILNQWSAIGLLIAAKSVFRFSDLSRAKDRKLTEYILIGTLMSFGLAILIGLIYSQIIKLI
jgi:hypothetical protein